MSLPATLLLAICMQGDMTDCTMAEPQYRTMDECNAAIPGQEKARRRLGLVVIEALCFIGDDSKP